MSSLRPSEYAAWQARLWEARERADGVRALWPVDEERR